jgi:hypothetical protein
LDRAGRRVAARRPAGRVALLSRMQSAPVMGSGATQSHYLLCPLEMMFAPSSVKSVGVSCAMR